MKKFLYYFSWLSFCVALNALLIMDWLLMEDIPYMQLGDTIRVYIILWSRYVVSITSVYIGWSREFRLTLGQNKILLVAWRFGAMLLLAAMIYSVRDLFS